MLIEGVTEEARPLTDDAASCESALSPTFGCAMLLLLLLPPPLDKSAFLDPSSSHIRGLLSGSGSPRLDPAPGPSPAPSRSRIASSSVCIVDSSTPPTAVEVQGDGEGDAVEIDWFGIGDIFRAHLFFTADISSADLQ